MSESDVSKLTPALFHYEPCLKTSGTFFFLQECNELNQSGLKCEAGMRNYGSFFKMMLSNYIQYLLLKIKLTS